MLKTVNYNAGTEDCIVALVLSCPGTEEAKSGKLVSGKTGENLNKVLQHLSNSLSSIFHSSDRYDYRITNSSNIVHPNNIDNRTEPLLKEIKDASNLLRLYKEIKDFTYVISFGKKAGRAVEECLKDKKEKPIHIHYEYHLGCQGINHIHKDEYGYTIESTKNPKRQAENTEKRLKVVAKAIIELIQKQSKSACPATSDHPS